MWLLSCHETCLQQLKFMKWRQVYILTHRLNVPDVKYLWDEFPLYRHVQYGYYLDKHLLEDWRHINTTNQLDVSNGSVKIALCSTSVFSGLLIYYYYFFYHYHQVVCWTFKKWRHHVWMRDCIQRNSESMNKKQNNFIHHTIKYLELPLQAAACLPSISVFNQNNNASCSKTGARTPAVLWTALPVCQDMFICLQLLSCEFTWI